MEMEHKKKKNISGSRNLAVWMLLPLKKKDGELRSRFARGLE